MGTANKLKAKRVLKPAVVDTVEAWKAQTNEVWRGRYDSFFGKEDEGLDAEGAEGTNGDETQMFAFFLLENSVHASLVPDALDYLKRVMPQAENKDVTLLCDVIFSIQTFYNRSHGIEEPTKDDAAKSLYPSPSKN